MRFPTTLPCLPGLLPLIPLLALWSACGGSDEDTIPDAGMEDSGAGGDDVAPGLDADLTSPDTPRPDAGLDAEFPAPVTTPDASPPGDVLSPQDTDEETGTDGADGADADLPVEDASAEPDVTEEPGWLTSTCERATADLGSASSLRLTVVPGGFTEETIDVRADTRLTTRYIRDEAGRPVRETWTSEVIDEGTGVWTVTDTDIIESRWTEPAPSLAGTVVHSYYSGAAGPDTLRQVTTETWLEDGSIADRLVTDQDGVQVQRVRWGVSIDGGWILLFEQFGAEDTPLTEVEQTLDASGRIVRESVSSDGAAPRDVREAAYDDAGRIVLLTLDTNNDGALEIRLTWEYGGGQVLQRIFQRAETVPGTLNIEQADPSTGVRTYSASLSTRFTCSFYEEWWAADGALDRSAYRTWSVSGPECIDAWVENATAGFFSETYHGPFGVVEYRENRLPDGSWGLVERSDYLPEGLLRSITITETDPEGAPPTVVQSFEALEERDGRGRLVAWRFSGPFAEGESDLAFFTWDDADRLTEWSEGTERGGSLALRGASQVWDEADRVVRWASFYVNVQNEGPEVREEEVVHTMTYDDTFPFAYCFEGGEEPFGYGRF
jgi:hypothetical protein